VSEERYFDDAELKALGQRTLDLLISSIDKGDRATAGKLAQRMYNEFLGMHDLYRDWVTHLLTFIGERFGDEVLAEALQETVEGYTRRLTKRYAGKSARQRIEMLLAGFRGHLHPFDVQEDDDTFVITPRPCGSGERLIQEGAYDPPRKLLRIQKAQAMTFNQADFPVYCAHCYFQNHVPREPGDAPLFVTEPSPQLGEKPCRILIHKE
jgi:hypothetical protein